MKKKTKQDEEREDEAIRDENMAVERWKVQGSEKWSGRGRKKVK